MRRSGHRSKNTKHSSVLKSGRCPEERACAVKHASGTRIPPVILVLWSRPVVYPADDIVVLHSVLPLQPIDRSVTAQRNSQQDRPILRFTDYRGTFFSSSAASLRAERASCASAVFSAMNTSLLILACPT